MLHVPQTKEIPVQHMVVIAALFVVGCTKTQPSGQQSQKEDVQQKVALQHAQTVTQKREEGQVKEDMQWKYDKQPASINYDADLGTCVKWFSPVSNMSYALTVDCKKVCVKLAPSVRYRAGCTSE